MDTARKFDTTGKPRAVASPATSATAELNDELIARIARLEAALTLTAGTVHDVNNLLTVLTGNLFLLTENLRGDDKLCEQARRARNAAERGSTLLRELLTFDRDGDDSTRAIAPGSHIQALEPLLARVIGADHTLKVSLERTVSSVLASAARFESAVINLVINARDALSAGGTVEIRVRDVRMDDERAAACGLPPGEYVGVSVVDDGSGIPAELLPRVTEPLFSTKPKDRGSGLGLAMVRHFAEQSGGALRIESREGRGTSVTIWMPRTQQRVETTANMTLPLSTLPGGEERLLLVTRDREARVAMQQILETLGYGVDAAESLEALGTRNPATPRPALLISERSGAAAPAERRRIDALRDDNPSLRHLVLLEPGADATEAQDADGHLYRPVTVIDLAHAVRRVLEDK